MSMGSAVATTSPPLLPHHRLAPGDTQARGRVLLAEDNIVNQHVATGMLKALGCHVDVVANGCEVLEALTQKPHRRQVKGVTY